MSKPVRYLLTEFTTRHLEQAASIEKEGVFAVDGEKPLTHAGLSELYSASDIAYAITCSEVTNKGKLLGYVFWSTYDPTTATVKRIVVDPYYRRHGLATVLLLASSNQIPCDGIQQFVKERNLGLQLCWRSIGSTVRVINSRTSKTYLFTCSKPTLNEPSSQKSARNDTGSE